MAHRRHEGHGRLGFAGFLVVAQEVKCFWMHRVLPFQKRFIREEMKLEAGGFEAAEVGV
jgi:hypothetical protein